MKKMIREKDLKTILGVCQAVDSINLDALVCKALSKLEHTHTQNTYTNIPIVLVKL